MRLPSFFFFFSMLFSMLFSILFLSIFLAGCSKQNTDTGKVQMLTANPEYHFTINITPNPAKILKENEIEIVIRDKAGKSIDNTIIKISFYMKGMDHGDIEVFTEHKEQGYYAAKVIPTMQGTWFADLNASIGKQQVTARYTFNVIR